MLPKYFSRAHKQKIKLLTEQDFTITIPTYLSKNNWWRKWKMQNKRSMMNEHNLFKKNADPSLCRDLCVNNARKDFGKQQRKRSLKWKQSMTGAIQKDPLQLGKQWLQQFLHKFKEKALDSGLTEDEIPSFSWFKFQFWPNDTTTHEALNYTGWFPINMMQQRIICKSHDDHYVNAIYKYSHEYAVMFRDNAMFICTDDKHKISVGEPDLPCQGETCFGWSQSF